MLEQIYADFTTKMLPSIQEGLVITKDYFMDLFGRYVEYLMIVDGFWMFVGIIIMIVSIIIFVKLRKNFKGDDSVSGLEVFMLFPFAFGFIMFSANVGNLAKDIFIPEIRIYEELKDFQK